LIAGALGFRRSRADSGIPISRHAPSRISAKGYPNPLQARRRQFRGRLFRAGVLLLSEIKFPGIKA
jgi:hypothetical protein